MSSILVLAVSLALAAVDQLPDGWRVERSSEATAEQASAIGQKLGGSITKLTSTVLSVGGERLQMNVMQAATLNDARKLEQALIKIKGNPRLVQRKDSLITELVSSNVRLALDARYRLGLQPALVQYRVSFDAAPLKDADYMSWNRLFNLFLEHASTPAEQRLAVEQRIAELSTKFSFGDELALRRHGLGAAESKYSLTPQARPVDADASGELRIGRLEKLPRKAGIPYVSVVAEVSSQTYAILPAQADVAPRLLAATRHWPAEDAKLRELAARITKDCVSDSQRIEAILDWLLPGKNLRYDGKIVGSRYGVRAVLDQGYGHCWDFSDCFVTLCRASGLPCRQVAGWLYGQSGHVWAEVLDAKQGWKQVDPTAGMACGSDYIPYLTTETGDMALVYVSPVRIEVLSTGEAK